MIQVTQLGKEYQRKPVLRGLDLSVLPGELVVLQGANGAGKTTLLRILSTLTRPTSGNFTIGGVLGSSDPESVRSQIGVMLHQPMVYGDLSAVENLRFFAALAGKRDYRKRIDACLDLVGLDGRNSKVVRLYSRGMQQRLAIARAILCNPAILLLDEPFTGLDAANQNQLVHLLIQMRAEGKTLLVTDHDLERVSQIATRVDYLYRGKIARSFSGKEMNAEDLTNAIAKIESGEAENSAEQQRVVS